MVHVIISQILKIWVASAQITQKKRTSLLHRKFKHFPFLIAFQVISDFKANLIFHVQNTNPLALSAHAVNYASHIKRGFIYPIIYHKAPLFKGNSYLLTEDWPR